MKRRLLLIILCLTVTALLCLLTLPVAADTTFTGECGEGLTWTLDTDTGILTVSGEGAMEDYAAGRGAPWLTRYMSITSLVIEEGVTSVGDYAFMFCSNMTEVTLPDTVTSVGQFAFSKTLSLKRINLPAALQSVGNSAFESSALEMALYEGSAEDWAAVAVDDLNDILLEGLILHPGHTFDRELTEEAFFVSAADCTTPAMYYLSCVCGAAGEETFTDGEALGHRGGEATCAKLAVCEVCSQPYGDTLEHIPDGVATCTEGVNCTLCGAMLEEALKHNYEDVITRNPTCAEEGERIYTCTRCEHSYGATIEVTEHTPGEDATCTEGQACLVCDTVLVPPLEHSYRDTVVPPTCEEQGYTDHVCTRCGHEFRDEVISSSGHTPGKEATCEAPKICTVCSAVLAEALKHDYRSTVSKAATCQKEGILVSTCSLCGDSYEGVIPTVDHTPGSAATCTDYATCTACGTALASPLGHTFTSTTVSPTCESQGYDRHTCSRCSATRLDSFVPAAGHTPGKGATCHAPQTCTQCGFLLAEALSHSYEETRTEATCTVDGLVTRTCTLCGDRSILEVISAAGHTSGQEATCHTPQTCTQCGLLLAEALSHSYEETRTEASCTVDGLVTRTCTLCGDRSILEVMPATGHTAGDWTVVNQPDVGEPGRRRKTCTVCEAVVEAEIFWAPMADESVESETSAESQDDPDETSPFEEKEGCQNVGGNILVVVIALAALVLLWGIDFRRRH